MTLQASLRTRDLGEDLPIRRDDHLGVAAGQRLAEPKGLTARDEEHLVRVGDDVFAANVPDEQTAVGQTDLEVRRETFRARVPPRTRRAQRLDQPDGRLQNPRSLDLAAHVVL